MTGLMTGLMIGYAWVSTDEQDLAAQLDALAELGAGTDRIYVDKGLTGTNRARPGLREALAACRAGDQFVVTKPDHAGRPRQPRRLVPAGGADRRRDCPAGVAGRAALIGHGAPPSSGPSPSTTTAPASLCRSPQHERRAR